MENKKIAAVGHREAVLPFIAVGAQVTITDNIEEAREAVEKYAGDGYPIIMVSDDMAAEMVDILDRYLASPTPCITAIPGKTGHSSFSNERINFLIKKAIGIDIVGLNK
ncbi:MAG: hypothetical protein GY754_00630 [bacterium]|nr:hypothetical protein [bacterium]